MIECLTKTETTDMTMSSCIPCPVDSPTCDPHVPTCDPHLPSVGDE